MAILKENSVANILGKSILNKDTAFDIKKELKSDINNNQQSKKRIREIDNFSFDDLFNEKNPLQYYAFNALKAAKEAKNEISNTNFNKQKTSTGNLSRDFFTKTKPVGKLTSGYKIYRIPFGQPIEGKNYNYYIDLSNMPQSYFDVISSKQEMLGTFVQEGLKAVLPGVKKSSTYSGITDSMDGEISINGQKLGFQAKSSTGKNTKVRGRIDSENNKKEAWNLVRALSYLDKKNKKLYFNTESSEIISKENKNDYGIKKKTIVLRLNKKIPQINDEVAKKALIIFKENFESELNDAFNDVGKSLKAGLNAVEQKINGFFSGSYPKSKKIFTEAIREVFTYNGVTLNNVDLSGRPKLREIS